MIPSTAQTELDEPAGKHLLSEQSHEQLEAEYISNESRKNLIMLAKFTIPACLIVFICLSVLYVWLKYKKNLIEQMKKGVYLGHKEYTIITRRPIIKTEDNQYLIKQADHMV